MSRFDMALGKKPKKPKTVSPASLYITGGTYEPHTPNRRLPTARYVSPLTRPLWAMMYDHAGNLRPLRDIVADITRIHTGVSPA